MSETQVKRSTNTKPRAPDPDAQAPYEVSEVAYMLGVSCAWVRSNAGTPSLPEHAAIGGRKKWLRPKFDKWLNDGCPKGAR